MVRATQSNSLLLLVSVILLGAGCVAWFSGVFIERTNSEENVETESSTNSTPIKFSAGKVTLWWDDIPREKLQATSAGHSNVLPTDYVGPEVCGKCHKKNYESWSEHPHRWMNTIAKSATVKGDFESSASIEYLGGRAEFLKENDQYLMRLTRDDRTLEFVVTQTIGSRFFQYYVGKLREGPKRVAREYFELEHVLPFGTWLERNEWVPIVHVGPERPDGERIDPFAPRVRDLFEYAARCNYCHTTFPLGDMLTRDPSLMASHAPTEFHWSLREYLQSFHEEMVDPDVQGADWNPERVFNTLQKSSRWDARDHAVTHGVSCEACHLGGKEHANQQLKHPSFKPDNELLYAVKSDEEPPRKDYINWACGRCHSGSRPSFANGIGVWNSTESSDAMRGSCYSQMTCVDCHNPHEKIGKTWSRSPDEDDQSCLKCHSQFEPEAERQAHTHHKIGSEGSRCMNCHMPRINEGLQDVVRTHTIFSPTDRKMIESNHINACNQCHLKKPIDWTVAKLKEWYGAEFSSAELNRNYKFRGGPVGLGWLNHENESVRLVAVDSLTRRNTQWALPQIIDMLDDPYLLNRHFSMIGLERMRGSRLGDFGYKHYMGPKERRAPIEKIRAALLPRD